MLLLEGPRGFGLATLAGLAEPGVLSGNFKIPGRDRGPRHREHCPDQHGAAYADDTNDICSILKIPSKPARDITPTHREYSLFSSACGNLPGVVRKRRRTT